MNDFELLGEYNKRIEILILLQNIFIDNTKITIEDKKIDIKYNKFNYYVINLEKLLLFEITDRYEFAEKDLFAIRSQRLEDGGYFFLKFFNDEDVNEDIYR